MVVESKTIRLLDFIEKYSDEIGKFNIRMGLSKHLSNYNETFPGPKPGPDQLHPVSLLYLI